jgi:acetyl esterase/lipase
MAGQKTRSMDDVDPDLRRVRFLPAVSYGPISARVVRGLKQRPGDPGRDVTVREISFPGAEGAFSVSLRIFSPVGLSTPVPAMLWIHGGGHILGSPEQDDRTNIEFARELGIVVAAVRYRLGAAAPAPASVEDVYAALAGLVARAEELHVDAFRIAIGGASAGGGIAAALALLAHDRGDIHPVFQLLVYPMLDDRTVTNGDDRHRYVWTAKSNRFGWATYLDAEPGSAGISPYAAPARREDLSGLPPAWIGVGALDLFRDEDAEYARRLTAAGVACEFELFEGAFHGFDAMFPNAPIAQRFHRSQEDALRAALLA